MADLSERLKNLTPGQRELLLKKLREKKGHDVTQRLKIEPRPADAGYPLSFQQKRLWFMHQLDNKSSFYNMPIAVKIEGAIKWSALEFALNEIVRRHEVLRSVYPVLDGQPIQEILSELTLNLKPEPLPASDESTVEQAIRQEFRKPFDLAEGPLIRVRLFQLDENSHVLVLTLHHIVADGWSVGVFIEEFAAFYFAASKGQTEKILPALKVNYADYAYWQNQWMQSDQKDKQLSYWKKQLADAPPTLELPYDQPRPSVQTFNGAHLSFTIPENVTNSLRTLSQNEGATLYMILLAAFHVLLFRYTNQDDINVGTAIANRERPEIRQLMGFFINTLVMRGNLSGNPTFKDFLQRIKQTALDAYDNQELPFELLIDELHIKRIAAYSPLFQVLFVLQNTPKGQLELPGIKLSILNTQIGSVKYDLTLTLEEDGNTINGLMGYNTDLFNEDTVQRMVCHYQRILSEIAHTPHIHIEDIPLLKEKEKQRLLYEWNRTERNFNAPELIHKLFENQAAQTPDATALIQPKSDPLAGAERQWTYRELNIAANRLAHYLVKQGIRQEDKVGICLERSTEMIAAMLGILKAGAAYLPIDPTYPVDRIEFMLNDSGAKLVLTQDSLQNKFAKPSLNTVLLDDFQKTFNNFPDTNPEVTVTPENLAYIIYTSGTTGQPKGVEVEHRNLSNYILAARELFALTPQDRMLQFSSISFDAAAEEIYPTLSSGATLLLRNEAMLSSAPTFLNSVGRFNITVLDHATAYWHQYAAEVLDSNLELPECVRLVVIGGERALPQRVRQWHQRFGKRVPLLNTYGPTESTVVATYWQTPENSSELFVREVPIGKPVANDKAYVLDKHLQPVPIGVPGELCIGGKGVARGYLNRPQLTAEKFMANPFVTGERIYRTGDLVRLLPDGNIEFLGRIDQQVKIRGFRIELGEVEAVLRKHPALREVVLLAREDTPGDRRLVAYYTILDGQQADVSELREHIKNELPEYMVPAAFVQLDSIPFSVTGKVNYRALPKPEYDRSALEQAYHAPRNELETMLAEIWQEILGVKKVGINDNFFELGGDSLKAAVFINRLQQALDEILYVVVLFDNQTITTLSEYLIENFPKSVLRLVKTRFPKPSLEKRIHTLLEQKAEITEEKLEQMKYLLGKYTRDEEKEQTFLNSIKKKNRRALFIVSAPRSGSTLLRVMLAGNPTLFSPPELALLNFRTLQERNQHFAGRDVGWMEGLYRAIMEIHQCDFDTSKKILAEYEEKNYTTAQFYGVLQEWLGDRIIVDKTTTYATDVRILHRAEAVFEEPFYIHLVRHPAAMIQSYLDSNLDQVFGADLPFVAREKAEMFWRTNNQNVLDFLEHIPEERRFFIRYEDLVQQPEKIMRTLCDKLDIEYDPEMLNPYSGEKMRDGVHKESKMVGDPRFNTHRKIDPNLAFKWQSLPEGDRLSPFVTELGILLGYSIAEKDRSERQIPLKPFEHSGELPLSFAQQRLWFLDQLEPGQANYNIPSAIRLRGNVNIAALIHAIHQLAEHHKSLRTVFATVDGKAQQIVKNDLAIPVERINLTDLHSDERLNKAMDILRQEARTPFNLAKGPLMRVKLIELADDDHLLMLNMHHIISDGWSVGVIIRDLSEMYKANIEKRQAELPALPVQYVDYAIWQRKLLSGARLQLELKFWEEQFKDAPALLELPTDRPRPAVQTFNGQRLHFELPEGISAKLNNLANELEATPFMVLMAAFQTLLHHYAGQETILVGTPVANRNRREIENVVGFFVNTLIIRGDFNNDPDFYSFLQKIKQRTNDAFAHQELPFEKIVDSLKIERNLSHNPLFQVMFAYQPPLMERMRMAGIEFKPLEMDTGIAKFDLTVSMAENNGRFSGEWEFNTDLWNRSTIERMITHFIHLLSGITENPHRKVSRYALMDELEIKHIIEDFNAIQPVDYPKNALLHELFEQQVKRTPDNIALVYKGQAMTYLELNERANQLAHFLIKKGVGPEQFVGISVERNFDLPIALFGILKAGAAYVPLDPSYPVERLFYMAKDTGLTYILTQQQYVDMLKSIPSEKIALDSNWQEISEESTVNPGLSMSNQNLCYVIYTSGSTGWPKGVQVQHNTVIILTYDYIYKFKLDTGKRLVQYFSYSFDGSVGDFFMTLFTGATLYLVGKDEMMPNSGLTALMRDNHITNAVFPPSLLSVLSSEEFPDLTMLVSGGDVCSPELARKWASPTRTYYNAYGPTETTVCATWYLNNDLPANATNVPIGVPIPHYRIYILDKHFNPMPIGVPGEMFIAGEAITRGYLNKPDLTAEKFLPDPFSSKPGALMYASGDLCRYLSDGNIEFLGRIDQQVKIRGFRIELGEIEAALLDYKAVNETVVLAKGEPGSKQLVAYLVPEQDQELTIGDLRSFLQKRLPEYMVPAYFVFLESMPVAASGKIDKKQLPEPTISRDVLQNEYIAPRNKKEEILADIWKELLNLPQAGVKDNFFELGGDSILSIQVVARANQKGLKITPKQIFEYPTIEGLAAVAEESVAIEAEQGTVSGEFPLTPIQRWFFDRALPKPEHWNQSLALELKQKLDSKAFSSALQVVLNHHDILRAAFDTEKAVIKAESDRPFKEYNLTLYPAQKLEEELERIARELQGSFILANPPLMQVGYIRMPDGKPDILQIVLHHLIVDSVSWRVLLEDLLSAYQQIKAAQTVKLPPKTTSFKYWAEKLQKYALSAELDKELPYWQEISAITPPELPVDFSGRANCEQYAKTITLTLNEEETSALLKEAPSAYQTQVNELLLTALARALHRFSGYPQLYIDLEGHGREDLFEEVDISRTVGWFTVSYPFAFTFNSAWDIGELIKKLKEHYRRIPRHGIGFSLLRYIRREESLHNLSEPLIGFNYLGRFEQAQEQTLGKPIPPLSPERAAENPRVHLLEIGGNVYNNVLTMNFSYSTEQFKDETVLRLANSYMEELRLVIEHCLSPDAGGYTASDFQEAVLDEDELDDLLDELEQ